MKIVLNDAILALLLCIQPEDVDSVRENLEIYLIDHPEALTDNEIDVIMKASDVAEYRTLCHPQHYMH